MSAVQLLGRPDVSVWHADWKSLLAELPRREDNTVCDALIVDCPYSERTHAGHDGGNGQAYRGNKKSAHTRRALSYAFWTTEDVAGFVEALAPLTRGWIVSLTDDVIAPAWAGAMEAAGRYAFSPIACVAPGSRVRLVGDGPAQWSTWAMVSRPRDGAWLSGWRTGRAEDKASCALPGAYILPPGHSEPPAVVGGKPLWLMRALVRDYTRPGDLVCDPCCGAGTTLLAAVMEGRRAVGGDVLEAHAQLAAARLDRPVQTPMFGGSL